MSEPLEDGRRQLRNVRVDVEFAVWAQEAARERGVGLGVIVEEALRLLHDTIESHR